MSEQDANAAYNVAYDHGFRAGAAVGADRIEALEAALRIAVGELTKGTTDQRDTALKITRIAALAPEQDK